MATPPPPPARKHAWPQRGEGGRERGARNASSPSSPFGAPWRDIRGRAAPSAGGAAGAGGPPGDAPLLRSSGSLRGRGPITAPSLARGTARPGKGRKGASSRGAPLGPTGRSSRGRQHEGARQPLNTRRVPARSRRPRARLPSAACLPASPARLWPPTNRRGPKAKPRAGCRRSSTEPPSPRPPPGQPRRGSGGGSSKARPGAAAAAYLLPSRLRPSAPHRGRGGRARGGIRPGLRSRAGRPPGGSGKGRSFRRRRARGQPGGGKRAGQAGRPGEGSSRRRPRAPFSGISRTDRSPPVLPLGRPPGRLPEGQGSGVLPTESEPSPSRPPKLGEPRGRRPASGFNSGKAATGPAPPSACAQPFREVAAKGASPSGPEPFPQASVTPSKRGDRLWPPSPQPLP